MWLPNSDHAKIQYRFTTIEQTSKAATKSPQQKSKSWVLSKLPNRKMINAMWSDFFFNININKDDNKDNRLLHNNKLSKTYSVPIPCLSSWLILTFSFFHYSFQIEQELQEVLKFPIEIFWNLEASLKSELVYF